MNSVLRLGLLGVAALLILVSCSSGTAILGENDPGTEPAVSFAKLQSGMSPNQVRRLVGVPQRVARQILYQRYREQWIYLSPVPFRLTFDCPRGQTPRLLSPPRRSGEKNHGERGASGR